MHGNKHISTCSADSDDRRRLMASPATEKTLSDGAELAGTDIYVLAKYPSLQRTLIST